MLNRVFPAPQQREGTARTPHDLSGTGQAGAPCCAPTTPRSVADVDLPLPPTLSAGARRSATGFVSLPAASFRMGTDDPDGFPRDLEGPVRQVRVAAFRIAATAVTNDDFGLFARETGYVTDAERYGWSFVFHLLLHPAARDHVMPASIPEAPWWMAVRGATWRAPYGPGSDMEGLGGHPVVHVSHRDARAYCQWAGARLPTEKEWEYAARGGLDQARYPWGDELTPDGRHMCNIWQGEFPRDNTAADGWVATAPARSFPPNGYGLFNMVGNTWEFCADRWRHPGGAPGPREVVIRGGSYLCHRSYCNRYRVAARSRTTPDSSSGNTSFRVVTL